MYAQLTQTYGLQSTDRRRRMPDLQALRKKNLRALIKQWEGPTNLAKKLQYSGPSYLSQLTGPHKPITEKTARFIEATVGLPSGWLDMDHTTQTGQLTRVDTSLINRVMLSVSGALDDAGLRLTPIRMADLVSLVYECATEKGEVDDEFIARLIKIIKG